MSGSGHVLAHAVDYEAGTLPRPGGVRFLVEVGRRQIFGAVEGQLTVSPQVPGDGG